MTHSLAARFARDRRANVAMTFALIALPLIFVVGMAIDYGAAARLKSKLNSAADAAALAAVTPAMMNQTDAIAATAAKNMFTAHVTGASRLVYSPNDVIVTITHDGLARNVTVAYAAKSKNIFAGALNMDAIPLGGSATASAATPPNIDFYLLLDTSPSMAIAGTPADIAKMVKATASQGGCAFACHQANPGADNLNNPGGVDNFDLARSLGVVLRADLLGSAVTDLTKTAYRAQTDPSIPIKPAYRMSINSFDVGFAKLVPLTANYVSAWATQLAAMKANETQFLQVYSNNNLCSPTTKKVNGVTTTDPCGAGAANSDADTNYDAAMTGVTALVPTPGNGTTKAGDTPQAMLFVVTDGVEDENVSGKRQQSTMTGTKDWCTPLKTKGVKIAILYTEYFPLPTNSWYNTYIAPFQASIGSTLQKCASPGLFYQVGMGQDISAALSRMFQTAVNSSHLTD